METEQVFPRRGVQRLRPVRRGGHVGTEHSDRRRRGDLRHGRTHPATDLAVHSCVRQEDAGLAAGVGACEDQEYAHHQSALRVQHGVRVVQTVLEGEAKNQGKSSKTAACLSRLGLVNLSFSAFS